MGVTMQGKMYGLNSKTGNIKTGNIKTGNILWKEMFPGTVSTSGYPKGSEILHAALSYQNNKIVPLKKIYYPPSPLYYESKKYRFISWA